MTELGLRPLEPWGAEVDLDLARPLAEDEQAALRRTLDEFQLLVFHGQQLRYPDQVRAMGSFGPVLLRDPYGLGDDDHRTMGPGMGPPWSYVTNAGPTDGGAEEITYHSDLAYCPEPFRAISLHALDVVDHRSATRFVNGVRACRRIPDDLRERVAGLVAKQVYPGGGPRKIEARLRSTDLERPGTERPVVWPHPRTGEPVLAVSRFATGWVVGMDPDDSRNLLGRLFDVLYDPADTVEHRWCTGDLVVWDNLALQHARGNVPEAAVGRRLLQKVVVAERGQAEQFPWYTAWRTA